MSEQAERQKRKWRLQPSKVSPSFAFLSMASWTATSFASGYCFLYSPAPGQHFTSEHNNNKGRTKEQVVHRVRAYNPSAECHRLHEHRARADEGEGKNSHFTGPSSPSFSFVSASRGVEANTHTPPSRIRIAVERPPTGNTPNRANGLREGERPGSPRQHRMGTDAVPRECPHVLGYLSYAWR